MRSAQWLVECLDRLAAATTWGYRAGGPTAAEPCALAALALIAGGRRRESEPLGTWLANAQQPDGRVGVRGGADAPGWPTGLAALAWRASGRYPKRLAAAVHWLLATKGAKVQSEEKLSHDMALVGWPWVEGTHSWVEPTALGLMALRAVGRSRHRRAQEAARLLVDRLLPVGGCNYGNTFVLGQQLVAHLQPTGLALLALARLPLCDARIGKSLDWLAANVAADTAAASLSYAILALSAHERALDRAMALLSAAYHRVVVGDAAPYQLALLALAAQGEALPLVPFVPGTR
jgi:hypothetical protein